MGSRGCGLGAITARHADTDTNARGYGRRPNADPSRHTHALCHTHVVVLVRGYVHRQRFQFLQRSFGIRADGSPPCDERRPSGSQFSICSLGTDCTDCGPRCALPSPPPPPSSVATHATPHPTPMPSAGPVGNAALLPMPLLPTYHPHVLPSRSPTSYWMRTSSISPSQT